MLPNYRFLFFKKKVPFFVFKKKALEEVSLDGPATFLSLVVGDF